MAHQGMKGLILGLVLVLTRLGFASDCLSARDMTEIASHFDQFDQFLNGSQQYCEADLGDQWYQIANSLSVLLNIDANEPELDEDDALTFKAIEESDWWAYFTKRANEFVIQKSCPQSVVAYVQPFWGAGTINLCELFFEQTVSSQASTLMHEVRHFDGHRHVTCSQGNEQGNQGACDSKITNQGSYAISVQTLVGMARSNSTVASEKPLLEAEAVYMAFNKFNEIPQVKINPAVILSQSTGDVLKWDLKSGVDRLGQLSEPALVMNSANNLTIYPTDSRVDAYRKDNKLIAELENPGLFAKQYNQDSPEERALYRGISYFGTGGVLKANTLYTLCDAKSGALHETDLSRFGEVINIITLSKDPEDKERESALLAQSGEIHRFECDQNGKRPSFQDTGMRLENPERIVDSFGLEGRQYALLDDGRLAVIDLTTSPATVSMANLPVINGDFISASPINLAEVF